MTERITPPSRVSAEYPPQLETWLAPLLEKIRLGQKRVSLRGVWGSARGLALAGLHALQSRPILVITASSAEGRALFQDIQFFHNLLVANQPAKPARYFPPWEVLPYEPLSPQPEIAANRLNVLYDLLNENINPLMVTPLAALMHRLIPRDVMSNSVELLGVGEEIERERVIRLLCRIGYKETDMVESREEFSVRGGILDFFGPGMTHPVRIEFFGDEIASIRTFDYETQRSLETLGEVVILPAREAVLTPRTIQNLKENVSRQGQDSPRLREELLARLELGSHFSGIEQYIPFLYNKTDTLLNYMPSDTIAVLDEPDYIETHGASFEHKVRQEYHQIGKTPYPPPDESYLSWEQCKRLLNKYFQINLASLSLSERKTAPGAMKFEIKSLEMVTVKMRSREETGFLSKFADSLRKWKQQGQRIFIICATDGQAERMRELLFDYKLTAGLYNHLKWISPEEKQVPQADIVITVGDLSAGFRIPALSLVVISENDVFGEHKKIRRRPHYRSSRFLSSFSDLQVGDFVVHVDHGIGRYLGLSKLELDNRILDFLLLEYQDNDKLYVPLDRLYLVQKHMGDEEKVELYKLGGRKWARQKEKVKASLLAMADELVKLYAAREVMSGFAFAPDSHWQKEFEASFEYTETDDQLKAIEDIKRDMEQEKSMDRLICGDVGYGKTEVALRAAFKAVENGKQVAFLVPTTILAQQHFTTLSQRLAPYPFRVEMLSRFRSAQERAKTKEGLKNGTVDIVVGTHALLQKDIKFANLGLLVIDEEQHFGVKHKEKIKSLRQQVDVLTLTATPIPRTLHFAFSGLRDLSIIATPPEGRMDIHTEVLCYDKKVIREAVLREKERGGQVFFVHNRVENIEQVADQVRQLIPEARITVAHGKMSEKTLEAIMLNFINGEYDVLVCTTIIESGLDVSNANTMIINRADTFGLSQLYQLRGRVGRSDHRAYAYLMIPPGQIISKTAKKRLQAIQELSELGAGFRLAAHDLEIRGAGNLLGPQQHGHIASIGFGLYCDMMEEAVNELKGLNSAKPVEPVIELNLNARLSEEYIPDTNQRLTFYKRLSTVESEESLERLHAELRDRYGRLAPEGELLIKIMGLKIIARELGITKLQRESGNYRFTFSEHTPLSPDMIIELVQKDFKRISITPESQLLARQFCKKDKEICAEVKNVLLRLREKTL